MSIFLTFKEGAKVRLLQKMLSPSLTTNPQITILALLNGGNVQIVPFGSNAQKVLLIEEFMLLANRTVAEAIGKDVRPQRINGKMQKKAKSFVYRIHDQPSQEKLESLATLAARFGHNVKSIFSGKKSDVVDHSKNKQISQGINQLMKEIHNRPEENMLSTLAIRTQAKAVYSTENIGHYGLAFDFYTHFTSPIRRYPDCMVHRLLDRYLFQKGRSMVREMLEEECKHCSEMEQLAVQAERSSTMC